MGYIEYTLMCFAKPLQFVDTIYWAAIDSKMNAEMLMEQAFDEKEKWDEGLYLLYVERLQTAWEHINECVRGFERQNARDWVAYGRMPYGEYLKDGFNQNKQIAADFGDGKNAELFQTISFDALFIKCATRYNTKRFIKKMVKLDPEGKRYGYIGGVLAAQGLTKKFHDGATRYITPDGKQYSWSCGFDSSGFFELTPRELNPEWVEWDKRQKKAARLEALLENSTC